jgi:hypothetical protein
VNRGSGSERTFGRDISQKVRRCVNPLHDNPQTLVRSSARSDQGDLSKWKASDWISPPHEISAQNRQAKIFRLQERQIPLSETRNRRRWRRIKYALIPKEVLSLTTRISQMENEPPNHRHHPQKSPFLNQQQPRPPFQTSSRPSQTASLKQKPLYRSFSIPL